MSNQRIYAGVAGGKRYFHGENGKLFDEAGVEQPPKLAAVLKSAFPPPPPQTSIPNPTTGRAPPVSPVVVPINGSGDPVTPQPSGPQPANMNDVQPTPAPQSTAPPRQPQSNSGSSSIASQMGLDLLRIAFPDLYSVGMRYRKLFAKKDKAPSAKVASKQKKDKKSADAKRTDKELSLKIDTTASLIRTNGELLRQQLTAQTEAITLLEKLVHSGGGSGLSGIEEGVIGAALFGSVKKLIIPALAAVGVIGAGAAAYYAFNHAGKFKADELAPPDDAPEPEPQSDQPSIMDHLTPDPRTPRQRAEDRAKYYENGGAANTAQGPINDTKRMAEAREHKPSGKIINIKADSINFEARTIKLDALNLVINSSSSSSGSVANIRSNPQSKTDPAVAPKDNSIGGPNDPGQPQYDVMGNPTGQNATTGYQSNPNLSNGRGPAQSEFKSDITTPWSPGANKPGAPGQGSITGSKGATTFGGESYDRRSSSTAEAIRKNDIAPTQSFTGGGTNGEIKPGENNPRLAASRASFFEHMANNPQTKDLVIKAALNEGGEKGLQANIEQFVNYGQSRGMKNFDQVLKSGFFGSVHKWQKTLTPQNIRLAEKAFEAVQAGSNKIEYRNDQGMKGDPNFDREARDPRYRQKNIDGAYFADHPEVGVGWAANQKRLDAQYQSKEKPVANASSKNIKNLTGGNLTSDMFGGSIADMHALGNVAKAAEKMDLKEEQAEQPPMNPAPQSSINKSNPVVQEALAHRLDGAPKEKFTDQLIQKQMDKEGGWLWQHLAPSAYKRREQLSTDPWQSEPGFNKPVDTIPNTPSSIPDYDSSSIDRSAQHASDTSEEPTDKSEGNHSRLSDHVSGSKKPKTIRPIDLDKYYPQYPKSDYSGQTVGIAVT